MSLPIAVLVSGGGSNLQALIDKIEDKSLDAEIKIVISNKKDSYGLKRAENHNIKSLFLDHKDFKSRNEYDAKLVEVLKDNGVESIILAGFMRIITPTFLDAFPDKIINIHPALLPSFTGINGQKDANEYGVKLAGCTVHYVNEIMDNGAIIIQAAVPAFATDSSEDLSKRILEAEHRILPQAVQWLAKGRLKKEGRIVKLISSDLKPQCVDSFLINPPLEKGF